MSKDVELPGLETRTTHRNVDIDKVNAHDYLYSAFSATNEKKEDRSTDAYSMQEDEEYERDLTRVNTTLREDIKHAIIASRYTALVLVLLVTLYLHQHLIVPYDLHVIGTDRIVNDIDKLVSLIDL